MMSSVVYLLVFLVVFICQGTTASIPIGIQVVDPSNINRVHSRQLQSGSILDRLLLTGVEFDTERANDEAYAAPVSLIELDIRSMTNEAQNSAKIITMPNGVGRCRAGVDRYSYCRTTRFDGSLGVGYTGYGSTDGTITPETPRQIVRYNSTGHLIVESFSSSMHFTSAWAPSSLSRYMLASHSGLYIYNSTLGSPVIVNTTDGSPVTYNISYLRDSSSTMNFVMNRDDSDLTMGTLSAQDTATLASHLKGITAATWFSAGSWRTFVIANEVARFSDRGKHLNITGTYTTWFNHSKAVIFVQASGTSLRCYSITASNKVLGATARWIDKSTTSELYFESVRVVYTAPEGIELQGLSVRPVNPVPTPSALPSPSRSPSPSSSPSSSGSASLSPTSSSSSSATSTYEGSESGSDTGSEATSDMETPSSSPAGTATPTSTISHEPENFEAISRSTSTSSALTGVIIAVIVAVVVVGIIGLVVFKNVEHRRNKKHVERLRAGMVRMTGIYNSEKITVYHIHHEHKKAGDTTSINGAFV